MKGKVYKDFRTKTAFESAFKRAVTNFDHNKIWFEHKSKSYEESKVCFMLDGIIKKVPMYKGEYYIEIWKNYFIEFLETGKFDMNAYFELYPETDINPNDIGKIYSFPMDKSGKNEFYDHSKEMSNFLYEYRKKYNNCGIKRVPKPNINLPEKSSKIRGFLTGSFRPFHAGHMALIEYAKKNCDNLTILVTTLPDEIISYKHRMSWVLSTYLNDPQVDVINAIIKEPTDLSYDDLSRWWGNYVKSNYGKFDKVFTSENYGKVFAETMGAEHCLFDIDRNLVPVSATVIREKPLTNWNYINNFAKDYFVKKIAIVGTESTGKTVLSAQLAKHFDTTWCPELGRELVRSSNEVSIEDIEKIGVEHAKHILKHTRNANKILIVDTDLTITKSYSKFIFGHSPEFPEWVEEANKFDLYIYLASTAPYVDDGTRFEKDKRDRLANSHLELFNEQQINLKSFDFDTSIPKAEAYEKRFKLVVEEIENFIKNY